MRTLPLGIRIVLLVIPLAFMPLALVGGVAYSFVERATRQEIDAAERRLLSDAVTRITGRLDDVGAVARVLPELPQVRQFIEAPRDRTDLAAGARQAMDVGLRLPLGLSGVSVLRNGDAAGRTVTVGTPTATPDELQAAWSAAAAADKEADGARQAAVIGRAMTVLVVRGVPGPQGPALIGVEVAMSSLMGPLEPLVEVPPARLDLVDDAGQVLASVGAPRARLSAAELAAMVRQTEPAGQPRRVQSPGAANALVAMLDLVVLLDGARPDRRPLFLVRTAQENELVGRVRELRRTALQLSLVSIVFGLIGAGVIARTVVHPLGALLDMTRRIGEGQFGVSLEQSRDDEIGQLVGAVNRMAAALAEFQDKLIRAETFAALGRVASTIAHEVRNPLNAMRGCIEYLRLKRPDDPLVQHHTGIIGEEITALDRFITDFLRVARLEHPHRVPVDLAALLGSHLRLHEPRAADLGVSIEFDHGDGPFEASADPAQIGIVFENLIVNALDAMPAGGRLRVGLSSTSDGLTMTFADTGPGMDPSVERQAFTPFFSTKPEGAGVGLAISRRILDTHGGSIRCETAPGAGSRFIVTLPREQADSDESSAEPNGSLKIHHPPGDRS